VNLLIKNDIGLAAYLFNNGAEMLGYKNRVFEFDNGGKTLEQWKLAYATSCCASHDSTVVRFINLMKTN